MKNRITIMGALLILTVGLMSSCSNNVKNIPAGYKGKVLTPTGWQKELLGAGQVDLGVKANNGTSSSLVLLESTTKTVKESFPGPDLDSKDNEQRQDHRCKTQEDYLAVDIYVQIAIPTDENRINTIFQTITASETKDPDVSVISVEDVYVRYAQMTIRGNVRSIFAKYKNSDDVMANYQKINGEISDMIIDVVKKSGAPFDIIAAQLSNVKEDPIITESKNKIASAKNEAQAINTLGEAIRNNPQYLMSKKLDVEKEIGSKSGNTFIMMDAGADNKIPITIPAK